VIISQEERVYKLLETPMPQIETVYAVTDHLTGQQLEYRHMLKRLDLRPTWKKAFANEFGCLA
jgi:hypothetical protein